MNCCVSIIIKKNILTIFIIIHNLYFCDGNNRINY